MFAGNSKIEVGTLVIIENVTGADSYLNGKKGYITHPFGYFGTGGDVGVMLVKEDSYDCIDNCNLKNGEFRVSQ